MKHVEKTEIETYTCDLCENLVEENKLIQRDCHSKTYHFCQECYDKLPKWVKMNERAILTSIYQGGGTVKELLDLTKKYYCIFSGKEDNPYFTGFDTKDEMEECILEIESESNGETYLEGVVINGIFKIARIESKLIY